MITTAQWQEALDIQNACNLSGVVHTLTERMADVWAEAHELGQGTEYVNRHPLVVLYLDKLTQLAGLYIERDGALGRAYEEALKNGAKF